MAVKGRSAGSGSAVDAGRPPGLSRRFLENLIFAFEGGRRFTQDSPVLPDVWLRYGEHPLDPRDLLITPHRRTTSGRLAAALRAGIGKYRGMQEQVPGTDADRHPADLGYSHANVVARLYFDELVRVLLPMTSWWRKEVLDGQAPEGRRSRAAIVDLLGKVDDQPGRDALDRAIRSARGEDAGPRRSSEQARRGRAESADGERETANQRADATIAAAPVLFWMAGVVGSIAWAMRRQAEVRRSGRSTSARGVGARRRAAPLDPDEGLESIPPLLDARRLLDALRWVLLDEDERGGVALVSPPTGTEIYLINDNRIAEPAIDRSALAIKADAARQLFSVDCSGLSWAIVDAGIDARHSAFFARDGQGRPVPAREGGRTEGKGGDWRDFTRVVATYDFTRLRPLLDPEKLLPVSAENANLPKHVRAILEKGGDRAARLKRTLKAMRALLLRGGEIDWSLFREVLQVPHDDAYDPPARAAGEHGTHVAGILAADWWSGWPPKPAAVVGDGAPAAEPPPRVRLRGVCPDIRLYDLRVLGAAGSDEFGVIAALQFIRHLNRTHDHVLIHGANLSLSIHHDVANYACGRTPVCEECERLVADGVAVIVAAGNRGYLRYRTYEGIQEGYHTISITDPGNAEGVITVGATHRYRPHTYGVSYFSSRGPTGDGRSKPDLVAPGEKVNAPIVVGEGQVRTLPVEDQAVKDGTSMAAPHVSGAAALLMARNNELVGDPRRVKRLLCESATDLGRERYFQGAGMLDVLRAMQAV